LSSLVVLDFRAWGNVPRADAVGLVGSEGQQLMRRWEDLETVCGNFRPEAGVYPPRCTPPPWPDADAWRRLETEFSPPAWFSDGTAVHGSPDT